MRLLLDTDAFCKLAVGGILDEAIGLLGATPAECGRLPALHYMLKRGSLHRRLGNDICNRLIPIATRMPIAAQPADVWLDKIVTISDIDPGEAQIFAVAAELRMLVISGDKRALRVLKDVPEFVEALSGRIVVLEAVLLALCDLWGVDTVRQRIRPLIECDKVAKICFSEYNLDPAEGLLSYIKRLRSELAPLVLWDPRGRDAP